MRLTIADYFEVEGKFDSRDRHMRQLANPNQVQYWMTTGRSIEIKVNKGSSWSIYWRFEVGPCSVAAPYVLPPYTPAAGFATSRAGGY